MESEDWRLIGCVALRVGLHEGDGEFDFLTINKVSDTPPDVMSHLTVQLAEQGDRFIHQPIGFHLIQPVEDHLAATRESLHLRGIFPQQLLRGVHLRVVTAHVDFLSLDFAIHRLYSPDSAFRQCVDVAAHAVGQVRGALDIDPAFILHLPLIGLGRWCRLDSIRHIRIEQGVLGRLRHLPGLGGEGVVELDDGLVGVEALALYLRPDGEAVEGRAARQGDIEHSRAEHLGVDGAALEGLPLRLVDGDGECEAQGYLRERAHRVGD